MVEESDVQMSDAQEESNELMPFMDTFYSLASNDLKERSFAASSMMSYLFLRKDYDDESTASTVKDGNYALTRLLNGLCSGRASARQGFASCLATFLRLSAKMGPEDGKTWIEMMASAAKGGNDCSLYVRKTLKECTNYEGGAKNKKGGGKSRSDEREFRFGRLFGILAIVRSGTLDQASEKVRIRCTCF